jgi:hypothetical protein
MAQSAAVGQGLRRALMGACTYPCSLEPPWLCFGQRVMRACPSTIRSTEVTEVTEDPGSAQPSEHPRLKSLGHLSISSRHVFKVNEACCCHGCCCCCRYCCLYAAIDAVNCAHTLLPFLCSLVSSMSALGQANRIRGVRKHTKNKKRLVIYIKRNFVGSLA